MADYWIVRKGQLDVDSLYTIGDKGRYWYQVGSGAILVPGGIRGGIGTRWDQGRYWYQVGSGAVLVPGGIA